MKIIPSPQPNVYDVIHHGADIETISYVHFTLAGIFFTLTVFHAILSLAFYYRATAWLDRNDGRLRRRALPAHRDQAPPILVARFEATGEEDRLSTGEGEQEPGLSVRCVCARKIGRLCKLTLPVMWYRMAVLALMILNIVVLNYLVGQKVHQTYLDDVSCTDLLRGAPCHKNNAMVRRGSSYAVYFAGHAFLCSMVCIIRITHVDHRTKKL